MSDTHWVEWHRPYDDPSSPLSARLAAVQSQLAAALTECPPGPIRLLSLCAGQGRDVLGVLPTHARRDDVTARLVDIDEGNVEFAAAMAAGTSLERVECVAADASSSACWAGVVPAQVLVACGVFGNLADDDIRRMIGLLPMLCDPGAFVVWTRHRRPPDLTSSIREWFAHGQFEERAFVNPDPYVFCVGTHQYAGAPATYRDDVRLFHFVGDGSRPA